MKKRVFIITILVFLLGLGKVNAASISMSASTGNVIVGNTFTVTVTVGNVGQSAGQVGSWQYCVDYNSTNLTLTSPSSPCSSGTVGDSTTSKYTFKANNVAQNTIGLNGVLLYDYETEQPMEVSKGSVKVNADFKDATKQINDNTNLSGNNNLRLLEVTDYTITPQFSKDVTEYSLDVPGDVEKVQINAFLEDKTATITPIDFVDLNEGANKFSVTVTAQNGKKKTYTITITRAEANPIIVKVDGKEYKVVTKEGALEIPAGYTSTTIKIDDKDVVAYKNEQTGIIVVVLKDQDSNMNYFMYKDGEYTLYEQISSSSITIVPIKPKNTIKGYEKTRDITVAEKNLMVYCKDEKDNLVLIYGINTINGEESWYYYDIKEGTILKYTEIGTVTEEVPVSKKSDMDYKLISLVFVCLSGLALLLVIILVLYVIRLRRKNEELYNYMEKRIKKHRDSEYADEEEANEKADIDTISEEEQVVQEEPVAEEEIEEEEVVEEDTIDDKTILFRNEDIIDLDEDDYAEEPKKKDKNPTLISDTDILRNIAKANAKSFEDDEEPKTKKEEKMLKKKKKALEKKAQREFLNDEVFEESAFDLYERDETEVLPVVKKKARTKSKTKGRKKA